MKCSTRECDAAPTVARAAHPKEQIELSTGRVATVIHECVCGWKRFMPGTPEIAIPKAYGSVLVSGMTVEKAAAGCLHPWIDPAGCLCATEATCAR